MDSDFEKRVKSAWNCWKGSEWNQSSWQDCCSSSWECIAAAQAQQFIQNVTCAVFLALYVSICFCLRKTSGTWKLTCGWVNVLDRTQVKSKIFCLSLGMIFWSFLYSGSECGRNGSFRPVLKHGPRSLTYVRVHRWQACLQNESDCWDICTSNRLIDWKKFEYERMC